MWKFSKETHIFKISLRFAPEIYRQLHTPTTRLHTQELQNGAGSITQFPDLPDAKLCSNSLATKQGSGMCGDRVYVHICMHVCVIVEFLRLQLSFEPSSAQRNPKDSGEFTSMFHQWILFLSKEILVGNLMYARGKKETVLAAAVQVGWSGVNPSFSFPSSPVKSLKGFRISREY